MINITEIMDMLDWNMPSEVQTKGINLAQSIENIENFLQPLSPKYNINVWDNCAKILSEKPDEVLEPYLNQLLEWLQDLNWPGAFIILERLKTFSGNLLKEPVENAVLQAEKMSNEEGREWLAFMSELLEHAQLKEVLSERTVKVLKKYYHRDNWSWGPELYQNDVAAEIKAYYNEQLYVGKIGKEITKELLKQHEDVLSDEENVPIFWFALADTQWDLGRLEDRVKEQALHYIDEGGDLRRWEEDDPESAKIRAKVLADLKQKLLSPQPTQKTIFHSKE